MEGDAICDRYHADVYSHIIDDDRCLNAQRMEEAFYSGQSKQVEAAEVPTISAEATDQGDAAGATGTSENETDAALLMRLLQKPEMAQLLKTLAQSL